MVSNNAHHKPFSCLPPWYAVPFDYYYMYVVSYKKTVAPLKTGPVIWISASPSIAKYSVEYLVFTLADFCLEKK